MLLWMILMMFVFFAVIRFSIWMAWGALKLIFGLGLFWLCPLLFIVLGFLGVLGHGWIPIVLIALLLGRGFSRQ